jgi:hypothetical protein
MNDLNNTDNIENDLKLQKIKDELLKSYSEYKKTLIHMASDAPIAVLCLSKPIENILISSGYNRIYDLFDADFVKIKGLGDIRRRELTTALDQFFAMF